MDKINSEIPLPHFFFRNLKSLARHVESLVELEKLNTGKKTPLDILKSQGKMEAFKMVAIIIRNSEVFSV